MPSKKESAQVYIINNDKKRETEANLCEETKSNPYELELCSSEAISDASK